MNPAYFKQHKFAIRCEWGLNGVAALQPHSDVMIIVDVMSFSTCVDVAVSNGAFVYPFARNDESAQRYAAAIPAELARPRRDATGGYSLSPASLRTIPPGTRLVLPSPNGATLSRATGITPTIAGCLRNARAVAHAAHTIGGQISVIAAGERWPDGSLRPAIEDWIGAGAIIAQLAGNRSPEAEAALRLFESVEPDLAWFLTQCSSGRELIEQGYVEDVQLATELNVSECVPLLHNKAYQRWSVNQ